MEITFRTAVTAGFILISLISALISAAAWLKRPVSEPEDGVSGDGMIGIGTGKMLGKRPGNIFGNGFGNRISPLLSFLIALDLYWLMASIFFINALRWDTVLIPGDILSWMYPWKAIFPHASAPHNPLLGDALSNYYPWMSSLKRGLQEGYIPLWNFNSYSGSPLVANFASAIFNPYNLFLGFMSVADFTTLMPFLRIVVAASGCFLFLRALRFSRVASFTGGTLFGFAGFQIVWLSNYPNITVISWLPWLMLCMHRIAEKCSPLWLFLLVVFSVFQFLGGHPESSFHMYLLVVPYLFYRLVVARRAGASKKALGARGVAVAVAGGLSIGCVAFQLFPFMEYLPHTTRYFEIVQKGSNIFGNFSFVSLLKLIAGTIISPDFFGNPVNGNYSSFANYNEQNTFFTVTGLLLALIAIFTRYRGDDSKKSGYGKTFFLMSAIISFAMVVRVPLFYGVASRLPLFSMAANYRLIFIFVFCMAVLATAGVDIICESSLKSGSKILFSSGKLTLLTALVAIAAIMLHLSTAKESAALLNGYRQARLVIFFISLSSVFLIILISRFSISRFSGKMPRIIPYLVLGVLFCESVFYGIDYNTFTDRALVYPDSPVLSFFRSRPGRFRVIGWSGALIAGAEQVYDYNSITGYDPMKIYAYEKILTDVNDGTYSPIFTCEIQSLGSKWINFLNVRYIVTPPDNRDEIFSSDRFNLMYEAEDGKVYENLEGYPAAFFAENVISAHSREEALKIVHSSEFSPEKAAVVEISGNLSETSRNGAFFVDAENKESAEIGRSIENGNVTGKISGSLTGDPDEPQILKYGANEVVIKTKASDTENSESGHERLLVLSEVWFPGWKVAVDGKPEKLLRVDSTFMGVMVKDGEHVVRFRFMPDSFSSGLRVASISFLVTCALAIVLLVFNSICLSCRKKDQTGVMQRDVMRAGVNQRGVMQAVVNQSGVNQSGVNQTGVMQSGSSEEAGR